jgi:hypothetical protein
MRPTKILLAALVAAPAIAGAQDVPCASLPNPVYIQTGDTQEPLMKRLGRRLRDSAAMPISIIYLTAGSCTNIDAMFNKTKPTMNPKYVPSSAEDPAWTPSMPSLNCTIDPAGVDLDIGVSAVFLEICTATPVPAELGTFVGPVQPYVFAVPQAS